MGSGSVELGWRDLRPGTVGKWEDTGSRLDFFQFFIFYFFVICYIKVGGYWVKVGFVFFLIFLSFSC